MNQPGQYHQRGCRNSVAYCLGVSTGCSDLGAVVVEEEGYEAEEDCDSSKNGSRHLWPKVGIVGLANNDEAC